MSFIVAVLGQWHKVQRITKCRLYSVLRCSRACETAGWALSFIEDVCEELLFASFNKLLPVVSQPPLDNLRHIVWEVVFVSRFFLFQYSLLLWWNSRHWLEAFCCWQVSNGIVHPVGFLMRVPVNITPIMRMWRYGNRSRGCRCGCSGRCGGVARIGHSLTVLYIATHCGTDVETGNKTAHNEENDQPDVRLKCVTRKLRPLFGFHALH